MGNSTRVLCTGMLVQGKFVAQLENEISKISQSNKNKIKLTNFQVITPSLPTFPNAKAISSPIVLSLLADTEAIC